MRHECGIFTSKLVHGINQVFSNLFYFVLISWSGGGGERTLWAAVVAIVQKFPTSRVTVLCATLPTEESKLRVRERS